MSKTSPRRWLVPAGLLIGAGALFIRSDDDPSAERAPRREPLVTERTETAGARTSRANPRHDVGAPGDASEFSRADLRVDYEGAAAGNAGRFVRHVQHVDRIPVLGASLGVISDAAGGVVARLDRLVPEAWVEAARRDSHRDEAAATSSLARTLETRFGLEFEPREPLDGALRNVSVRGQHAPLSVRARRVYLPASQRLIAAHQVEVLTREAAGSLEATTNVYSDADGRLLRSFSHRRSDGYRVFADGTRLVPDDSPYGSGASPHPTGVPDGTVVPLVAPSLLTLESYPFSRLDPWLPTGAPGLSGNNAFAYVDRAAPDGFDPALDLEVPPTGPAVFDRSYDDAMSPTATVEQSRAVGTHAFFVANFLHDFLYDDGFDEAAGNAQARNFGRGGYEGDRLLIEVQDHALGARSQAVVPPDGVSPRISFGIHPGASAEDDRDAALDTTLVVHELGHLLSERLVGDGLGLSNAQGRAIAEGVSDFLALLVSVRPEDVVLPGNSNWQGVYAVGGYAASATDTDAHYFGLRRVPYSTDTGRNALGYRHVARGAALPGAHPIRLGRGPVDNPLPHAAGEVWGTMLWECYASLLNAYPFEEARARMRGYLIGALRATPSDPTFVEARDALIGVAAASDPADSSRFRAAFAKRGLGAGASAPSTSSSDLVGGTESYAQGVSLRVESIVLDDGTGASCDLDGILDQGELGRLRITLVNDGATALAPFSGTVTGGRSSAQYQFPSGNVFAVPGLSPGARATRTVSVELTSADPGGSPAGLRVVFDAPGLATDRATVDYDGWVHTDERRFGGTEATFDTQVTWFEATEDARVVRPELRSEGTTRFSHLDDGPSAADRTLISPPVSFGSAASLTLRMRHSLALGEDGESPESGLVVEISEDGTTFVDVGALGASVDYVASVASARSPLHGRAAFVGMSDGFPGFVERTIDFGDQLAGKTVLMRLRIGSGSMGSAYGVDVDRITFTGLVGAPFEGRTDETWDGLGQCTRPPVADAGDDRVVDERVSSAPDAAATQVVLDGSRSFSASVDPATFVWTQILGPAVALDDPSSSRPTFAAPDVEAPSRLSFRLDVSTGTESASDVVHVLVLPVVASAPDAGVEPSDAGVENDAGSGTDAGTESDASIVDATVPPGDGGSEPTMSAGDDGCSCSAAGRSSPLENRLATLGLVLAVFFMLRRRGGPPGAAP